MRQTAKLQNLFSSVPKGNLRPVCRVRKKGFEPLYIAPSEVSIFQFRFCRLPANTLYINAARVNLFLKILRTHNNMKCNATTLADITFCPVTVRRRPGSRTSAWTAGRWWSPRLISPRPSSRHPPARRLTSLSRLRVSVNISTTCFTDDTALAHDAWTEASSTGDPTWYKTVICSISCLLVQIYQ